MHDFGSLGLLLEPTGSPRPAPLQRKCACGSTAAGPTGECGECRKKRTAELQTKLQVSEPGDAFEQEADRVADQVLRMSILGEGDQKEPSSATRLVQRRVSGGADQLADAPPIVHEVLRSPGQSLESAIRVFFEPRFGYDFSRVRVHADERAAGGQCAGLHNRSGRGVCREAVRTGGNGGTTLACP